MSAAMFQKGDVLDQGHTTRKQRSWDEIPKDSMLIQGSTKANSMSLKTELHTHTSIIPPEAGVI